LEDDSLAVEIVREEDAEAFADKVRKDMDASRLANLNDDELF
jgi:hypothetical protein